MPGFKARYDGRRRTQISARDAQKAFDMHDSTPVKPGQAGQRSISDARAGRSNAAVRVLTQKGSELQTDRTGGPEEAR